MNKKDQVLLEFRVVYEKMAFLNKLKMEISLKGFKPSEVHCIEYIGRNGDSNITKLAVSFYMTRGAVSKLTKKLLQKSVVECYQKPDNKKEVYLRLTDQGKAVYKIHEDLHGEFEERDKKVFEQVTDEQYEKMLTFLQKYRKHLDMEIKKTGVSIIDRNDE